MALPNGELSHEELLDAQAHIWNHLFNFMNSMALKCTIQLGIPDIIHKHGKPMMLSELTQALSINEVKSLCLERLMRVMVHSKFFIKAKISDKDDNDKEGYWLTPSSLLLMRDDPSSVAPFVLSMLDPILTDPWNNMSKWLKTVDHATPFISTHGMTLWEIARGDERVNQLFNESMAKDTQLVSEIIVKDCKHIFEGLKTMVDVGGGTGTMAKVLIDAFPGLTCTVLDLPHVVRGLEGSTSLTYVEGDMFKFIPPADAIFFKWMLHGWSDEDCVKVLKKCRETIPNQVQGGKVIIIDMVVDLQKEHKLAETQLFFDMLMIMVSGRERTEEEWANLFVAAGFTTYKITNVLGLRSIIEVFP